MTNSSRRASAVAHLDRLRTLTADLERESHAPASERDRLRLGELHGAIGRTQKLAEVDALLYIGDQLDQLVTYMGMSES